MRFTIKRGDFGVWQFIDGDGVIVAEGETASDCAEAARRFYLRQAEQWDAMEYSVARKLAAECRAIAAAIFDDNGAV